MASNKTTLEDLLRTVVKSTDKDGNAIDITPEFRISVQSTKDNQVHFIIHPMDYNGTTIDFIVQGNDLKYLVEEVSEESTNIIELGGITLLNIPADRILKNAIGNLESVIISGFEKEEPCNLYCASSQANGAEALWLAEKFKQEDTEIKEKLSIIK